MSLFDRVICLSPNAIRTVHEVRQKGLFSDLVYSMRREGWKGRPLLVVELEGRPGRYQGLTGSHRVAAARKAGLREVPAIVLESDEAEVLRESENWDVARDRPLNTDGIALDLVEAGRPELGQFIRMDVVTSGMEMLSAETRPWDTAALDQYRRFGFHEPEVLEVMAVETWPCLKKHEIKER